MDGRLAGKAIIVAGAGGIGSGLAKRYASEGAQVVLGDIDEAGAAATAEEIRAAGGTIVSTYMDGGDEASIRDVVDRTVADMGKLDGFHANYACFDDGVEAEDVLGMSLDVFDNVVRVNMRGYLLCTRLALPPMLQNGGGSIVYTSSAAAWVGQPVRVAYAMTKLAIHALMRSVTTRFGPEGIRANAVNPGLCMHPRALATVPADFVAQVTANIPMRRASQPADVAAMCALLMSDEGAYITGQVLSVDGGNSMRQ